MLAEVPAIVRPADHVDADLHAWIAADADYQPSPADLDGMAIADALSVPAVARLLLAAREVMETNGTRGVYALTHSLVSFVGYSVTDPDAEPASKPSSEPAPF